MLWPVNSATGKATQTEVVTPLSQILGNELPKTRPSSSASPQNFSCTMGTCSDTAVTVRRNQASEEGEGEGMEKVNMS